TLARIDFWARKYDTELSGAWQWRIGTWTRRNRAFWSSLFPVPIASESLSGKKNKNAGFAKPSACWEKRWAVRRAYLEGWVSGAMMRRAANWFGTSPS